MTSRCSATTCHSPSGESTPPGKRQPMPTITTGSSWPERDTEAAVLRLGSVCAGVCGSLSIAASSAGLGCS
ncbi:hypothetical protein [Streptomyces sp. AGS-58]|uniref:hypothetical protein n=1 Tax=unclassified Streptomyces TaxID=2593676 RepID=UPI0035A359F9